LGNKILDINNLNVDFLSEGASIHAVKDFSMHINKNEIFGLVGESGSGKSTVIKSILRILPAPGVITKGEIKFKDQDILELDESELSSLRWSHISVVKQKALNSLNPLLKIKEQIIDTIRAHEKIKTKDAMERCNALMDLVEIDRNYLNSYPHELSGGMKQRVVIAIALALKPELIIMDEPTTALDVVIEKEIILKILDLKSQLGFSLLFITHDLNLILGFADRVGVMLEGELVDTDTAEIIKSGGNNPYTTKLINSIPDVSDYSQTKADKNEPELIHVKDLVKTYSRHSSFFSSDKFHAVDGVSFNVNKNEIVGLVGESGSGKSTISKILTKLIDFDGGQILFNGKDISCITKRRDLLDYRKKVQVIFQDPFASLNSIHTVYHHLSRPILIHRSYDKYSKKQRDQMVKKEIIAILKEVDLSPPEEFLYKFPHEMSGGERQRIALARVLLVQPQLIIADEPTSMLDMSIRMEILDLLKSLQVKKGISILFITHDIASACYLSNRLIVLKNGKIVDSGIVSEIINNPKDKYSKLLIDSCESGWFINQ
jgi:ABC-type glutathione transport system ATPase component